jgi:hypothetical protein
VHDALEVSAVHSLAGFNLADQLITRPPYSDPHHSASVASIVGGGQRMAKPGAISCRMTDADVERRIEEQAYDSAQRAAAAAGDFEEALGEVVAEARDLREKIASGVVSPDDARRALARLRQRHRQIAVHVRSIKIVYEGAVKTIEDPAARIAELTSKFGSLQQ